MAAGGALALALEHGLRAVPPGGAERWDRTNHRGRSVSLREGAALAIASSLTAGLPLPGAVLAGVGAAAVGAYDDVAGAAQPVAKGFRGHLSALRSGRLTTGMVKVVGIGAVAVGAALLVDVERAERRPTEVLLDAAVVAGSANLLNLLDLRPGRALKVGLLGALVLGQPGPAGAVAALLPGDLAERTMLGDSGANACGALLGLAAVRRRPRFRTGVLVVLALLNAASEVVSFSRVIDAVAPLRWIDRLGRLP